VGLEDELGDDDLFLIPCARIGGRAWNSVRPNNDSAE